MLSSLRKLSDLAQDCPRRLLKIRPAQVSKMRFPGRWNSGTRSAISKPRICWEIFGGETPSGQPLG
jgi:hypothetical protein